MKTIADLEKIQQKTLSSVNLRHEGTGTRVIVGMGTSGIAAGAREVVTTFLSEIGKRELLNVVVAQDASLTGAAPVVKVTAPGKETVTYENVKPEMVSGIVDKHVAE